jgi:phage-related protein
MIFVPGYEIVDFEFPSQYEPLFPLRIDNKPVFSTAQFNDEIEQVRSWGENQLAREFVVEYFLPIADANAVDEFLQTVTVYNKTFFWTAGNIVVEPLRVRCDSWTKEFSSHNRGRIRATFIETFSFAQRNYGLTVTGGTSYIINIQDSILSKGRGLGADTAAYVISGQPADLIFTRNLIAETASFSIDFLSAGPEFYILDSDAAQYDITVFNSDYIIGLAGAEDYFASMSAQVYGWDRDFQVDWWGD